MYMPNRVMKGMGIGKDIIPKDEIEITSANMMQMMTLEDTGDEDNPIKAGQKEKHHMNFRR